MRKIILGLLAVVLLGSTVGNSQLVPFPQSLPPNTVVGRTGISAGPAQAIPFAILTSNLLNFSGSPGFPATFQGNGGGGLFSLSIIDTATSATVNEWVAQFAMTSGVGSANHTTATKGGIYAHCVANPGSADCFGANFIGQASTGLGNTANVTSLEVDANNNNQNYGETQNSFRYNAAG